jgi:cytochrome c5
VRVGPGSTTCYVVRARDRADNRDSNTREVCATTPAAACAVDYGTLVQPILTARCTHCHDGDPGAPRFLDLTSYGGALAGGAIRDEVLACDWTGSLINRKTAGNACGRRMPADGPPWLSASERSRLEAWVSSGARRSCSEPAPCSDSTAPTFAGIRTTRARGPTTIEVCWNPATDATTSADAIVYEIYDAASPGGEMFSRPAPYAVSGGATCLDVTVAVGQRTCFVVRARDLAGNLDTNTRESCATTGGACFDYDQVVQPIFDARCVHCHSGPSAPRDLRWDSYANAILDDGAVRPCRSGNSDMIDETSSCRMPQDTSGGVCRACLTSSQIRLLTQWVDGGANRTCPWGGC